MEVSWAWLIIGLVAGTALGLMVMGSLVEARVLDASSAGYKRGLEHGGETALAGMRAQEQRWLQRSAQWKANEQKLGDMVLQLSTEVEVLKAAVEKFSPAKMAACSPEVERTLADVDLGQKS